MSFPDLVLGTTNAKKAAELANLLEPLGLRLRTLAEFGGAVEVVEDGQTFADNAAKKAAGQARALGQWVIGEDSGLAVDALEGAPGVYSARYSGAGATDQSNNARLLSELADTPAERRTAHYQCHLALSDPSGEIRQVAAGCCRGRIRDSPAGSAGFGYDPLFEVIEYHRTFAELGERVKACLSHRGLAMREFVRRLDVIGLAGTHHPA